MAILGRMHRRGPLLARVVMFLLGAALLLSAITALSKGLPDYRNFFRQPVSAHIALLLGVGCAVATLLPWPRRPVAPASTPLEWSSTAAEPAPARPASPGRNAKCPCGSGRKYKRCCLKADHRRARDSRTSLNSAALNRANAVSSATGMANRGLRGP